MLVLALITLLHVLCCAHGPTAAEPLRTDTLTVASSVACDPHRTGHEPHGSSHCVDADEPTVQPTRDHPTGKKLIADGKVRVAGAVYELDTGAVRWLDA